MGNSTSRPLPATDSVPKSRSRRGRAVPYVLGGTTLVLQQFEKMASLVPVPFIESGVKLALGILEVIETIRDNKEMCQSLLTQLGELMIVVMKPWVNRSEDDMPSDLRDNLKELKTRLKAILAKLEELRDARLWAVVLKSSDRTSTLKECQTQMDQAMAFFQVGSQIGAAMQLDVVAKNVDVVRANVVTIGTDVGVIGTNVINIARGVREIQKAVTAESSVQYPSSALPPKPEVLFGREAGIQRYVHCLDANSSPRLAILGPGGIGKTSIALATVANHRVKAKYGDRIHWIPGAEATTLELFVELVARSMKIPKGEGGDRKMDILESLLSSPRPRLLLLDNFETPWDIAGKQSDVEDFLCDLASVPHLTLLLTMRADQPPSTRIRWTDSATLPVLSPGAARELYLDIHKAAETDASLDALLNEMAYMPLAVRLMAVRGRRGEMPTALLALWKKRSTKMIDKGSDRRTSIKISIEMSIRSNLMQADPGALALLSILAELPGGARPEFLPSIAPNIEDVGGALVTLQQATLALKEPSTGIIRLLSPIRSFLHDEYPAAVADRNSMHQAYYALLAKYEAEPGDAIFLEAVQVLTMETVNVETILLEDLPGIPTEDGIRAAYADAEFQYWTIPRLEIIREAVAAARGKGISDLLAEGLSQLGRILRMLDRYDDAVKAGMEALEICRAIGDQNGAASCLDGLGNVYRMLDCYDDAVAAGTEALEIFRAIGDRLGAANCLVSLGQAYQMLGRYDDAVAAGMEALESFRAIGNQLGAANCLFSLGTAYRMLSRFDNAVTAGTEALEILRAIGNRLGAAHCLVSLGMVYRMLDRYDDAVTAGIEGLEIFRVIGDQSGAASGLVSLSMAYIMLDRFDDAVRTETEALGIYRGIGNQLGAANCLDGLGDNYRMLGRNDDAVAAGTEALEIYRAIGNQFGAANSLYSLGDAYRMLGRYDDAVTVGAEALEIFRTIGDRNGTANSLLSLGRAYWALNRIVPAVQVTEEALAKYREINRTRMVQVCLDALAIYGVEPS